MPITIHELAVHRGIKTAEDGSYSGADIAAVGFSMIGGCAVCAATIAGYNAYPGKEGFWLCEDCIGDNGYATVEEANKDIFGETEPKPAIRVFDDRELATVLHALRLYQDVRQYGREKAPEYGCSDQTGCDHFAEVEPLTVEEIDALCERLNLGPEAPAKPTEKKAGVYGCPHCKSTEGFRENNVLHAYADVNCFDSQGEPEYGGNSDVDWNSQRIDDADPEPYTCESCKNDFAEPEWIREEE